MAEKAIALQQPVISVRISEALRARLDSLKELLARKSGENVSTSEVAKQLLESAREERLEVAVPRERPSASGYFAIPNRRSRDCPGGQPDAAAGQLRLGRPY